MENNTGANDYTDFEKSERYLEILDEETDTNTHYVSWKSLERSTSTKWPVTELKLSVQLSAQSRYLIELLKEKDEHINELRFKENEFYETQLTEAKATIDSQAIEFCKWFVSEKNQQQVVRKQLNSGIRYSSIIPQSYEQFNQSIKP